MAELSGQLVPLVMVPRFTTYTGAGVFATAPLDVSEYAQAVLTFWRGVLINTGQIQPPTFVAQFEQSHDAFVWTALGSSIGGTNTSSKETRDLTKRWLRLKITLTAESVSNLAAITCWAVGSLERRVP